VNESFALVNAVDSETNEFLGVRLFPTRAMQLTVLFLCELREKRYLDDVIVLVDDVPHLTAALDRLGLRFHIRHRENRNSIERKLKSTLFGSLAEDIDSDAVNEAMDRCSSEVQ
jgi:putative transposase